MTNFDLYPLTNFLKLTGWSEDTLRQYRHRPDIELPTIVEVGKLKYMRNADVLAWLDRKHAEAEAENKRAARVDYMFQNLDVFAPWLKENMPDEVLKRAGVKTKPKKTKPPSDVVRRGEID